ncbi:AlbA family DNA-binding domain-containing protein [Mycolicibacterium lacusdiani]|uniref:AlbA family DNA-binding domain-containing protein n=1 Tax=Mycolicibacterium lacusdiani TaxID=2895283 RepID=UPI001F2D402E|nr:ATP-binding protein [Mycolicibacterium lacusdiani]
MIVPDGRTDYDKLLELLGNPEETHLDLKSKVDMSDQLDRLKFIKDAVTMANRPPGGYILIGVDDSGDPCMPIGTTTDRKQFDGARLGSRTRAYIEGEIHVLVQVHEHEGNEVVLIFVEHPRDKLPLPMSKDGQYNGDDNRSATVFRTGDTFVREGAENVPLRHAHWHDILSAYADQIRSDASGFAQRLLQEFISSRENPTGAARDDDVPLLMDMDEPTFAGAASALLRTGNDVRIRQFLSTLGRSLDPNGTVADYEAALDKWVVLCAQAIYFERSDIAELAIKRVSDAYNQLGVRSDDTLRRLAVVVRIYVLGSLAVRLEAWRTVHALALRPAPANVHDTGYVYSSWIRHGQVDASRADLTNDDRRGYLISGARELMAAHPTMRPDITDDQIPAEVTATDTLLNSTCEFDLAYCFIVYAEGTDHGEAWPSSIVFDEDRSKPMALRIVADPDVRRAMFPDSDDATLAQAMADVYHRAVTESGSNYGARWWGMPGSVVAFVNAHGSAE